MDRIANEIQKKKERENRELDHEKRKKMVTEIVSMKGLFFFYLKKKSEVGGFFVNLCILSYQPVSAIIWVHIFASLYCRMTMSAIREKKMLHGSCA